MTSPADTEHGYEFGPFRVDVIRRRLRRGDQLVPLTPRSFDTLLALVSHAGGVIEKDELMRLVWPNTFVIEDNLTQQISSLRKVLGDHSEEPTYILTIPRRGYRFLADVRTISNGPPPATVSPSADAQRPIVVAETPPTARDDRSARDRRVRPAWVAATIVVALLLAVSVWISVSGALSGSSASAVRFLITPSEGVTLVSGGVVSPDAHWLVYVGADSSGQSMLMLRAFDETDAKPLAGTKGASAPFWSPDSQFIGFFGDNDLKKVNVSGESVVKTLVTAFPTRGGGRGGGTWSPSGVIVYAPSRLTELYSVSSDGGVPHAVTTLIPGSTETAHQWPQFLPDGRRYLYTVLGRRPEDGGVYMASLDSPGRRLLLRSAVRTVFAPPGFLLFARDGSLFAQRFDPSTGRLDDAPRTIASVSNQNDVMVSAAGNQTIAYTGVNTPTRELAWYDRSGRLLTKVTSETVLAPALSPDETRVAGEHRGEIWLVESSLGQTSRFMLGPDVVSSPLWSPDGGRIAVASRRAIYTRAVNDSAREALLVDNIPGRPVLYDWSSDGQFILYSFRTPETEWDLWLLPLTRDRTPVPFLKTPFTEYQARISPDGNRVAYVSDESATLEVYIDAFPTRGQKRRVSTGGGMHPTWRGDSKELFFLTPDKKLVAADVSGAPALHVDEPHTLFQTRITGIARNHYTVSADGRRFLINSPISDPAITPITVVLNWPALLRH